LSVERVQHAHLWKEYCRAKAHLSQERNSCTPLHTLDGDPDTGRVKTMEVLLQNIDVTHADDLAADALNEVYLLHGTSVAGANGITTHGFELRRAGSNAGTMFGSGCYLAEASSKSDEYVRDTGVSKAAGMFGGQSEDENVYAFLMCRVLCGELFRVTKSDIPAIDDALESGKFDAVLGDREASVGTYREFVIFDEHCIYPEYMILYRRNFSKKDDLLGKIKTMQQPTQANPFGSVKKNPFG